MVTIVEPSIVEGDGDATAPATPTTVAGSPRALPTVGGVAPAPAEDGLAHGLGQLETMLADALGFGELELGDGGGEPARGGDELANGGAVPKSPETEAEQPEGAPAEPEATKPKAASQPAAAPVAALAPALTGLAEAAKPEAAQP